MLKISRWASLFKYYVKRKVVWPAFNTLTHLIYVFILSPLVRSHVTIRFWNNLDVLHFSLSFYNFLLTTNHYSHNTSYYRLNSSYCLRSVKPTNSGAQIHNICCNICNSAQLQYFLQKSERDQLSIILLRRKEGRY